MKYAIAIIMVSALLISGSAFAGANPDAKVAVHVEPHASRTCVKSFPVITGCADIITTEAGPEVDAFPVFFDLVEYQGFDYGLAWPGSYSCSFTSCSDLAIGTIVWPGDGISHAWYSCQPGPVGICGWGWIYGSGLVTVVEHPTAGLINVGDCSGQLDVPGCPYAAGIDGYIGDDPCVPCDPTGQEQETWGSIKSLFR
jgi:hypothetical protein